MGISIFWHDFDIFACVNVHHKEAFSRRYVFQSLYQVNTYGDRFLFLDLYLPKKVYCCTTQVCTRIYPGTVKGVEFYPLAIRCTILHLSQKIGQK